VHICARAGGMGDVGGDLVVEADRRQAQRCRGGAYACLVKDLMDRFEGAAYDYSVAMSGIAEP